jgi:large subunit ribosomal protein L13
MKTTHDINAEGRSLGRVATEAAKALMGKMDPSYTPHVRSDVKVTITNASKIVTRERKLVTKMYRTYSGYPGGARDESLRSMNKRKGHAAALKIAISRMLPRNSLRTPRLKNLIISE